MFTMLTQHTHWWVNEMSLPAYQTVVTSGLYRRADWLFLSCTLRHVLISRSRGNRFCVFSGVLVNELLHSILELSLSNSQLVAECTVVKPGSCSQMTTNAHVMDTSEWSGLLIWLILCSHVLLFLPFYANYLLTVGLAQFGSA